MTYDEVMQELERLGNEQTKMTFLRHGAMEPLFGVRIGDLKKLVKIVKKDQAIALKLYESGNSDAMYLSGLTVNPKLISKETLEHWVAQASWYSLAEYTVAGVAAESPFARELALEWMDSPEEMVATCGWSTYANYISITPDEQLEVNELRALLGRVRETLHSEQNRVRYTMNSFVITVGIYVEELREDAMAAASVIGKVHVDVGDTACKVPAAADYIAKAVAKGKAGVKKKTCIC
ncbi:DNA alkylation repair protein [Paenibacillus sp. FSL H8-0548]|uniref:DNA alkylation repair protein n=1 Tax=Paenibacillus sp. FSL H8-0548 TaxID=1920422 RepID=UPI00096C3BEF|nr:DNA alkylation repair protein [Paenibacillus sp. FSL H8-0548]OMF38685.1 DNA alkylation repair protein [Paenibacillus sp. FSL H8-0548]